MRKENEIPQQGLYRESFEHDNCGIGAIVNIKGQKSHSTVAGALHIVENLEHRAGKDAEGKTSLFPQDIPSARLQQSTATAHFP